MGLLFLQSNCSLRRDLRNLFDGYALTGVGFNVVTVLRQFGQFDIADEAVIDRHPMSSAFALALFAEIRDG